MRKISIVAGARPNFIKVAPLLRAISKEHDMTCQLVYTGSSSDPTLESTLFEDLEIPRPDVYLGVDSQRLNEITSKVMAEFDHYLDTHETDVVIVVDDLASTMAAAIVTKKRGKKLAHLVAGTRSFDINMPKEINRLVIYALSDYLFTAGIKSNSVATREQGAASQTYMVGNILMDNLRYNQKRLQRPALDVAEGNYIVMTLNRKALLSDEQHLLELMEALAVAAGQVPVIAPLRADALSVVQRLQATNEHVRRIHLTAPLPYLQFAWLTSHAKGIVTDSGNVAEEATFFSVPCITLNSYTEHIETVNVGSNVLVGEHAQRLSEEVGRMVRGEWKKSALPDRWDGRTAERIVQILLS